MVNRGPLVAISGRYTGKTWTDGEGVEYRVGYTFSGSRSVYSVYCTQDAMNRLCAMRAVDIQRALNKWQEYSAATAVLDGPTSGTWQEIVMADCAALNGEPGDGER